MAKIKFYNIKRFKIKVTAGLKLAAGFVPEIKRPQESTALLPTSFPLELPLSYDFRRSEIVIPLHRSFVIPTVSQIGDH